MDDVAITMAITDRYDHPRDEVEIPDVDYYFFTDEASADLAPEWWERVPIGYLDCHPRLQAKAPKLNPHMYDFLKEYKYVIWVDGGCTIKSEAFVEQILSYLKNGLVLSPHFDGRTDAYGEATIRTPKYVNEPLDEQVESYHRDGYPGNNGLFESGVLARNMESHEVAKLGAYWLGQVHKWSIQDQVSLPYCLWLLKYQPDVLPKSFREFGWVNVNAHTRED